jgi:DNA gyrase subunit B
MTGAGGKFDKDSYSFWWTHGVGFQWLMHYQTITATVHSGDGKVYQQEYEKGKTLYPVKQIGETKKRNNSYFYPDETILLKQQIFI